MSLNTSNTPDGLGVLIFSGEVILLYTKNVSMSFSHNIEQAFQGKKKGSLYLTSHRIIFMNEKTGTAFTSFALPFFAVRDVKLEQPLLGPNYLKGHINALPNGNFSGDVDWKLTFPRGGCIEFGQALLEAASLASRGSAPKAEYFSAPPPTYYAAQEAQYMPATGVNYGFKPPTHIFPDKPAAGQVYMYDAPPPYPGVYNPQQQAGNGRPQPLNPLVVPMAEQWPSRQQNPPPPLAVGHGGPLPAAYGAPMGAYGAPPYGAPSGAYGAPSAPYGAPSGAYGAPPAPYAAPPYAYGAPPSAPAPPYSPGPSSYNQYQQAPPLPQKQ